MARFGLRPLRGSCVLLGILAGCYLLPCAPMANAWAQTATTEALIDPADLAPSANTATDDEELRDIKPLRPAQKAVWPWIVGAIAAVVCLALAAWWWWRRTQRDKIQAAAKERLLPPHVIALKALKALHRVNFADEAAVRQYYFDISEVLRAYVTARFDLSASQLTTEEIFSRLPKLVELAPPENLRLRAFLAQTDQVKYALHQATPEEIGATYEQAQGFIEATIPVAVSAPPDTEGAP